MRALLLVLALLPGLLWAGPRVEMQTSAGRLIVELNEEKAPLSVANFLAYVQDGSYAGSLFHRVIPGFVAQGGGYDADYRPLQTRAPVANESRNGLSNRRGSLAMARTADPHSATRQFYFNLTDNLMLDAGADYGYAVFGQVVEGMEVLERIAAQPTDGRDQPLSPIRLESVRLLP